MENSISFERKSRRRTSLVFLKRDWIVLLATMIIAAGYAFFHPSLFSEEYLYLPGIGLTVSCWAMMALCCYRIGWQQLHLNPLSMLLSGCTLVLSASYTLYANSAMRLMNLPVLCILCVLCAYSLHGESALLLPDRMLGLMPEVLCKLGRYFFAPFLAVRNHFEGKKAKSLTGFALGIGICVPLLGLIMLLLCDADAMFGRVIDEIFAGFRSPGIALAIWNLMRMLALALAAFAFIFGLIAEAPRHDTFKWKKKIPAATAATVLLGLSAVYSVFVYVQCRYLFAGETAWITGSSYAEYAREGFFQLVIVALITLMVELPMLNLLPKNGLIRMLCGYVTILTMVIVWSALFRMNLYIGEYGMTRLRFVTLWGIAVIFAAMVAALAKVICPKAKIFAFLFIFTLVSWTGLNCVNIDVWIAKHNIDAYLDGEIKELDHYYLTNMLSVDAAPVVLNFMQSDEGRKVLNGWWAADNWTEAYKEKYIRELPENYPEPCLYDWSIGWLKME